MSEAEAWAMPDFENMKSVMYNGAYMIRTAVADMLEGGVLFPKGLEGRVQLIGGVGFENEEDVLFERALAQFTWFSYRSGFVGLPDVSYDTGWGCVHRTGQMLLMTALTRHLCCLPTPLLPHFRDVPNAPFSIQAISSRGSAYGKEPGQWFAPSTIAHVLKDLVNGQVESGFLIPKPLHITVVTDQTVRCKPLLAHASAPSSGVLLLIPFMFGMDRVDADNEGLLLRLLHSRYSIGILGGKPRHALYFVGSKANHLIYLDPHRVQPAYTEDANIGQLVEPKRHSISVGELDPCSLLAFYARGVSETVDLIKFLKEVRLKEEASYPMFDIKGYGEVEARARELGLSDPPSRPEREVSSSTAAAPRTAPATASQQETSAESSTPSSILPDVSYPAPPRDC